jgi:hypothetical protein
MLTELSLDDFFWCDHLSVTREIRGLQDLELKGFHAYCSRLKRDIDDSFCHRCFIKGGI